MFKKYMKIILVLSLAAVIGFAAASCKRTKDKNSLLILYPNWAEGIALTHLAQIFLKEKGFDVTIKPIEPGPIYASLAKGDADLFLDAWLPNTHKEYWKRFGSKLEKIGESFSNGTTGLVVPAYCTENSITDLIAAKDKYKGKIIGIGSGAGIHKNTEKVIKAYKLPYKQITSSGTAMIASLKKAYDKKRCVAITGWKPHFKWARYKLKYLEDPKKIYPKDVMGILARKGFSKDQPAIAAFFKKFNFKEKELYSLMKSVRDGKNPTTGAKKWYDANNKMINSWWVDQKKKEENKK
jgi:glycine betaine/proline transport system substrate-binding protein